MTGTYTDGPPSPIGEGNRKAIDEVSQAVAEVIACSPVEVELAILRAMMEPVKLETREGTRRYHFTWTDPTDKS